MIQKIFPLYNNSVIPIFAVENKDLFQRVRSTKQFAPDNDLSS